MERVKKELVVFGYNEITPVKGWWCRYGETRLATRRSSPQTSALLIRTGKDGELYLQSLERPCELRMEELEQLRRWSKLTLPMRAKAYNPTRRKWNCEWWWFLPKREQKRVARERGVEIPKKEDVRKPVGAIHAPAYAQPQSHKRLPFSEKGGKPQRFWGRTSSRL